MKIRQFIAALVLSMLSSVSATDYILFDFDPAGDNSGRTVANFLLLPTGAQQLALGMAPSMAAWDATDISLAAGNTAFFSQYQFAATHLEWLMGLRKEYAAGCIPILYVGTVGFYSQVFTFGRFDNARDIDEYAQSNPHSAEFNVGGSFAREFIPQKLGVGATASYIESRLAGDDGRAFSAGIDATFIPIKQLGSRIYVRNLGSPLKYNDTYEPLPLQMGLAAEYSPWTADDTLLGKSFSLSVALGAQKTADLPVQAGIGLEVCPIKQIAVRAGYEYSYDQSISLAGLSFGAGLNIKGYGADVAFKDQSPEFGWVWCASVKYATEDIKQKTAMDHYKIAEKHFKKTRYRLCIQSATSALQLNPDLWQAHELISRCIAIMRREEGSEIALIYTGNLQGQFAPLQIGNATMGGLARQATAIKKLRAMFPVSLTVDAGNFVEPRSHMLKAKFADTYFAGLGYNAASVGPGEMQWGYKKYLDENKKTSSLLIATNIDPKTRGGVDDMRIISAGKYSFAIFSVIAPATVANPGARALITSPYNNVRKELTSERVRRCNLRICILHAPWEAAKVYMQQLAGQGIDIVVLGSLPQKFDVPMKIGPTIFLSAGEFGKYVGALTLRFDKNGKLLSYNNRLVPLTDEIAADSEIDRAISAIITKIDVEEQGLGDVVTQEIVPEGVFGFVSNRNNPADIFLKIPLQHAEFPLTNLLVRSVRPRLSYPADKIAYLEENADTKAMQLKVMDLTGANKQALAVPGSVAEAEFTHDGAWIICATLSDSSYDIYRIQSQGGEALPLVAWPQSDERQIDVSPDGRQVAFASDRDGKWQVFLTDTAAETPVRITDPDAQHNSPRFSPDGTKIAYLSDRRSFGGKKDIWVHTIGTGDEKRITMGVPVQELCWLDNSETIIFSGGTDSLRLFSASATAEGHAVFIPSDSAKTYNETSPQSVLFKGQPKLVYVREYPDGEKNIYWINPDGTDHTCVVNSPQKDWLE